MVDIGEKVDTSLSEEETTISVVKVKMQQLFQIASIAVQELVDEMLDLLML